MDNTYKTCINRYVWKHRVDTSIISCIAFIVSVLCIEDKKNLTWGILVLVLSMTISGQGRKYDIGCTNVSKTDVDGKLIAERKHCKALLRSKIERIKSLQKCPVLIKSKESATETESSARLHQYLSTERTFSSYGLIWTKLLNRLGADRAAYLVKVYRHLRSKSKDHKDSMFIC